MATPTLDPRVLRIVETFGELIKDHRFRGSLDALSADVMDRCDDFFGEHAQTIRTHCPDATAEDIVSAVVGWMLGFPAGQVPREERAEALMQHHSIAAFISPWSAENASRVWRKGQH